MSNDEAGENDSSRLAGVKLSAVITLQTRW